MTGTILRLGHAGLTAYVSKGHPAIFLGRGQPEFKEYAAVRVLTHETLHLILFRWGMDKESVALDSIDAGWSCGPERSEARITGALAGIDRQGRLPAVLSSQPIRQKPSRQRQHGKQVRLESCRFIGCSCHGDMLP